jgi:hypothetical protein
VKLTTILLTNLKHIYHLYSLIVTQENVIKVNKYLKNFNDNQFIKFRTVMTISSIAKISILVFHEKSICKKKSDLKKIKISACIHDFRQSRIPCV